MHVRVVCLILDLWAKNSCQNNPFFLCVDYRPHRSLDWDNQETPAQAFVRKMPEGETAIDGQAGEEYDVR